MQKIHGWFSLEALTVHGATVCLILLSMEHRYTSTVCTRWYRPPEILLGERNYTYAIDIWGVGCIVAELFVGRPILQGGVPDAVDEAENDLDQYIKICQLCGTPSAATWKDFDKLPMGRFAMPKEMYEGTLHDFLRPKVSAFGGACCDETLSA